MEQPENVPVIELTGVRKRFGHRWALEGIDLRVFRGQLLTLFGPNGAGKTTLIRILAQLVRPTAGEIRVEGRLVEDYGADLRRKVGVISHLTMLYPSLTGRENLAFFARLFDVPDPQARIEAVLDRVALTSRADAPVQTYSRGMAQRLAIARAILHDPPILLLDEPYTGLDTQASDRFTRLLRELADGTRTLVLTTHNLEQGLELSHRVAVQVAGRIVYEAPVADLDLGTFRERYLELTREVRT